MTISLSVIPMMIVWIVVMLISTQYLNFVYLTLICIYAIISICMNMNTGFGSEYDFDYYFPVFTDIYIWIKERVKK